MTDGPLFDDIPLDHISVNFKKYVNFFRELTLLDEKITELGSIDHAIKEAKARFERASALEVELQSRYDQIVDEALARVKEAENEAKNILNKARVKESEVLATAEDKHANIVKRAGSTAKQMLDDANTDHTVIKNSIEASSARHDHIKGEIAKHQAKMVELTKEIEEKKAEHKAITEKHEKFLASIGAK